MVAGVGAGAAALLVAAALLLIGLILVWPRSSVRKGYLVLGMAMIFGLSAVHQLMYRTIAEDAFITFRYARNLVEGNGPVFNLGEHVEGYSNFSWMMIISALRLSLGGEIPTIGRAAGIIIGAIGIWLTYLVVRRIAPREPVNGAMLACLLLVSSASFTCYVPSGLETPLFAVLLLLVVFLSLGGQWWLVGLSIGLATMTRPEGVLIMLPIILWLLLGIGVATPVLSPRPYKLVARRIVLVVGSACMVLIPWMLWRLFYYGPYLLPNAMAAKMGLDPRHQLELGMSYMKGFMGSVWPVLLVWGLLLILAVSNWRRMRATARPDRPHFQDLLRRFASSAELLILLIILTFYGFYVVAGGDWMPGWRFFSPLEPLVAILLVRVWSLSVSRPDWGLTSRRTAGLFATVSLLLFVTSLTNPNLVPRVRAWAAQAEGLAEIGELLHRSLPADTKLAVLANGALSYYSQLPTIDWHGLTDAQIARNGSRNRFGAPGHVATDRGYILAQRPAIVVRSGQGFGLLPANLLAKEGFDAAYESVNLEFSGSSNRDGPFFTLWVLRDREREMLEYLTSVPGISLANATELPE